MITINNTVAAPIQNIQVLGNTVQGENLSDIKSVGIPQGDGTYKMSILSTNKNVWTLDDATNRNYNTTTHEITNDNTRIMTKYIRVEPNSSWVSNIDPNKFAWNYFAFDNNLKFIEGFNNRNNFTTSSNTKYIVWNGRKKDTSNFSIDELKLEKIQLEQGTTASEFTPAIHNESEILSPVPLEGIGTVKDRMYDDGENVVIDKNVSLVIFNGSPNESWSYVDKGDYAEFWNYDVDYMTSDSLLICNRLPNDRTKNEYIYRGSVALLVKILKSKLPSVSSNGFKELLSREPFEVLFIPKVNQKIVLPKTEKLNLTSHADKTHIFSESGEVDATFKGTVSKSLGASVNANTGAITDVAKQVQDLASMKGSEDVHYSTDEGYIVCKETNNGVVKNLEIKGKTLVNKLPNNAFSFINDRYTFDNSNNSNNLSKGEFSFINETFSSFIVVIGDIDTLEFKRQFIANEGVFIIDVGESEYIRFIQCKVENTSENLASLNRSLLLEGDHTQSPPSYFEGLKSVGEDVEQIEVLSTNGLETTDANYKEHKKVLAYKNDAGEIVLVSKLKEWDYTNDEENIYVVGSTQRAYQSGDENNPNCITDMTTTVEKNTTKKVYELVPMSLNSYPLKTMISCGSGAISPSMKFSITSYMTNLIKSNMERINRLENEVYKYVVTQNRFMLDSRYIADSTTFKVEYFANAASEKTVEVDEDLFKLILDVISVGKDNYDYNKMYEKIDFYAMNGFITWDHWDILSIAIELQYNPPVEEIPPSDII